MQHGENTIHKTMHRIGFILENVGTTVIFRVQNEGVKFSTNIPRCKNILRGHI